MKRMITQELINKIEALVNDEKLSYFLQHAWFDEGDLVIEPDQIHLQSEQDITISDLGSLFPTPVDDKLLAWDDGVLKNVDISVNFTHSFNDLDATLKALCESAVNSSAACTPAQWTEIKTLLEKSLYFYYQGYTMFKLGGYYPFAYVFNSLTANNGGTLEFNYDESIEELAILFAEA